VNGAAPWPQYAPLREGAPVDLSLRTIMRIVHNRLSAEPTNQTAHICVMFDGPMHMQSIVNLRKESSCGDAN
jgi:hypothetical protein